MENTESTNDVQNARTQQKELQSSEDKFAKRFIYLFAWFWSFISIAYISAITFMTIPQANVRFADTCLGFILGTIVATIIGFFFGSSQGSKEKDKSMSDALNKY